MTEVKKRRRGVTRVSRKHQITVPVDALRAAGLEVGDRLKVSVAEGGRIVLEREVDPVRFYAGALTGKLDRQMLEGLRGEWD